MVIASLSQANRTYLACVCRLGQSQKVSQLDLHRYWLAHNASLQHTTAPPLESIEQKQLIVRFNDANLIVRFNNTPKGALAECVHPEVVEASGMGAGNKGRCKDTLE
jgi:hypothetical protein